MAFHQEARRAARLKHLFREVLVGDRLVRSSVDATLFLEAIRNHESHSSCIETIISSKFGISAIRDAVRVDSSTSFALFHTLPFLQYLSNPGIKALVDGQHLQQLLLAIAHPQTVWKMLLGLFRKHEIPQETLYSFAWLALELVSLPPKTEVDVLDDVRAIVEGESLLKAEAHETRELGYKIKHV